MQAWDGDDKFKWVMAVEHVPSDCWAKTTVVREVMDWYFHFLRNAVEASKVKCGSIGGGVDRRRRLGVMRSSRGCRECGCGGKTFRGGMGGVCQWLFKVSVGRPGVE